MQIPFLILLIGILLLSNWNVYCECAVSPVLRLDNGAPVSVVDFASNKNGAASMAVGVDSANNKCNGVMVSPTTFASPSVLCKQPQDFNQMFQIFVIVPSPYMYKLEVFATQDQVSMDKFLFVESMLHLELFGIYWFRVRGQFSRRNVEELADGRRAKPLAVGGSIQTIFIIYSVLIGLSLAIGCVEYGYTNRPWKMCYMGLFNCLALFEAMRGSCESCVMNGSYEDLGKL